MLFVRHSYPAEHGIMKMYIKILEIQKFRDIKKYIENHLGRKSDEYEVGTLDYLFTMSIINIATVKFVLVGVKC